MRKLFPLALILCLFALPVSAQELAGKVIGITDGDSLTLMTRDKQKLKVRLAEIDAPERKQPYGQKARQALSDLVFQQDVIVEQVDTDKYGRVVGKIYKDGQYVNQALVILGAAWVYRQYSDDPALLALEAEAKESGAGLWKLSEAERVPPWEWRKLDGDPQAAILAGQDQPLLSEEAQRLAKELSAPLPAPAYTPPDTDASVTTYVTTGKTLSSASANAARIPSVAPHDSGKSCGGKRTCGEMSDCSEARFYLTRCGLSGLDRDKDGVPCEKLCR